MTPVRKNAKSRTAQGGELGRDPGRARDDQSRGRGSTGAMPDDEAVRGGIKRSSGQHPLPWRNQPAEGDNHVTDANGDPVYDGADAAAMFRLYNHQAQAEAGKNERRCHHP